MINLSAKIILFLHSPKTLSLFFRECKLRVIKTCEDWYNDKDVILHNSEVQFLYSSQTYVIRILFPEGHLSCKIAAWQYD